MIPFLAGERVPDLPHATGALEGLRPGLLRSGHVFRAALEGVALNLAWGVERMRGLGLTIDRLRAVGGGARNALWRSILADCLDATVEPCEESESAALGAALQALWTSRRAAGQPASMDALAAPSVRLSDRPIIADPERARLYADHLRDFRQAVEARFDGGGGAR
jgi:xylulokinase